MCWHIFLRRLAILPCLGWMRETLLVIDCAAWSVVGSAGHAAQVVLDPV
jgi:hypothetical protein